jgi:hypothetical protein
VNLKSLGCRFNSILATRQSFVADEFGRERISEGTFFCNKMVPESVHNVRIAAIIYHRQRTLPAGNIPPFVGSHTHIK